MGMSKGLMGAISAPAGYGAVPLSKKYVSKMTHGVFKTIISIMILYFKQYTLMISRSTGTRLVSTTGIKKAPTNYNANVGIISV